MKVGEMIAMVSGRGGVGKSTLACLLGCGIQALRKRVLLLDFCVGMRQLDLLLGLESRVVFDMADLLEGECVFERALVPVPGRKGLDLLSAPQFLEAADFGLAKEPDLEGLVRSLAKEYDWVVVDTPSGLGPMTRIAARLASRVLLVACPEDGALRDAERAKETLRAWNTARPWIALNRVSPRWIHEGLQYAPDVAAQTLDLDVIGVVPEDLGLRECMLKRDLPLPTDALPAVQSIARLSARAIGAERIPTGWQIEKPGFWERGTENRPYHRMVKEVWL